MAQYTVTIKDILKSGFDLGLKDYPIYDENYRPVLNAKILNHYMLREIGLETPAAFKLYLNNRMNEIMPKYNILYRAIDEYSKRKSLLGNYDMTTEESSSNVKNIRNSGSDTTSSNATSKGKNINSDTPQGEIKNQDIDNENIYATDLQLSKGESSGDSTIKYGSSVNDETVYEKSSHTYGSNGKDPFEVLDEIREKLVDVDAAIIQDLSDLFMGLY